MYEFKEESLTTFLQEVAPLKRSSECEYLFDFRGWRETKNDHRTYVLVKQQQTVIGFAIVENCDKRLSRVFIAEHHRKQDLLKQLVHKYDIQTLGVFNNLQRLITHYLKLGFEITNPNAKLVYNLQRNLQK